RPGAAQPRASRPRSPGAGAFRPRARGPGAAVGRAPAPGACAVRPEFWALTPEPRALIARRSLAVDGAGRLRRGAWAPRRAPARVRAGPAGWPPPPAPPATPPGRSAPGAPGSAGPARRSPAAAG